MKNAFYFILKALFVLKIFKFPKKICVTYFIENPLKMIKNAFVSSWKLFSFSRYLSLSWLSGHVGKTAWLER